MVSSLILWIYAGIILGYAGHRICWYYAWLCWSQDMLVSCLVMLVTGYAGIVLGYAGHRICWYYAWLCWS